MTRAAVLSDDMWTRIEPLLPPVKGAMGKPMKPHRPLVEGAIYRYRTGVAWRHLPAGFGPWQTVWKRHHRFSLDGTWDSVLSALQSVADVEGDIDRRGVGGLHDQPGASARRDRCEVAAAADLPHRGLGRMTRISSAVGTNRTTTPSAAPAVA